ncbi:2-methylisocitrate lyase [Betaproteobacteria bacterium GR16-43]|nr:2-methylisocitrate lyase [Betaproteobacteria bacterium GR16-43]
MDIQTKAQHFRALHQGPRPLLIANAWDAGTARILAGLGFQAIATSSGAHAGTLGRRDGKVKRDEALEHARLIAAATDLPVSADLEKGFGDRPEDASETIRLAGATGLVGGSIEDSSGDKDHPIFDIDVATARIAASVAAARTLPFAFTLTARCESHLWGPATVEATIARLQAYERAGADVLMAPALPDLEAVRKVCASLTKPFSFMAGIKGKSWSVAELEACGVKRISFATSLYRAALGGMMDAGREILEKGTFIYLDRAPSSGDVAKHFE